MIPEIRILSSKEIIAMMHKGKLVSIRSHGHEYMHGAERPCPEERDLHPEAWSKSELTMFPLIGPAKGYQIEVNNKNFPFDQHGISRCLPWSPEDSDTDLVYVAQQHFADEVVLNPKFKEGGPSPKNIEWPFDFTLEKIISIPDDHSGVKSDFIEINFNLTNQSPEPMPYMFGWHPAFRYLPGDSVIEVDNGKDVYMDDVLEASRTGALMLEGTTSICYQNGSRGLEVTATGFRHMMLWSPSPQGKMFCIEPVTHLPQDADHFTDGDYDTLDESESAEYSVLIRPF